MKMITSIINYVHERTMPMAIIDQADSSCTVNKRLLSLLMADAEKQGSEPSCIMTFKAGSDYGFAVSPPCEHRECGKDEYNPALTPLQYNPKTGTYGFEMQCPTAARVIYDYGIKGATAKLRIKRHSHPFTYYTFQKP